MSLVHRKRGPLAGPALLQAPYILFAIAGSCSFATNIQDLLCLRHPGLWSCAPAPPPLTRDEAVHIAAAFAAAADADGRIAETFRIVHFSGWAPHPDQPRPARRGSAGTSLIEALKPKS